MTTEEAEKYFQEDWGQITRFVNRKNEPKAFSYNEMLQFAADFSKEQNKELVELLKEILSYKHLTFAELRKYIINKLKQIES